MYAGARANQGLRHHRAPKVFLLMIGMVSFLSVTAPAATLIATGSNWKYLDNGSDQGTAWRDPAFDDAAWASGPAELGYGDGGEATVIGYGPDTNNRYITTYFRRLFHATDLAQMTLVTLRVLRDDGAVVYLNGTEVFRTNMPAGPINYLTPASSAVGGADETTYYETTFSPALLREGANLLAVEVHQSGPTSSDVSFNLELTSDAGVAITRGPYLNTVTTGSVIVRWRTDVATDSRVRFGTSPTALNSVADDPAVTTEHIVTLTGLAPDTFYSYSIGSTSNALSSNDAAPAFRTAPEVTPGRPIRVWAIGDFGLGNPGQRAVYNAYRAATGADYTDVWLWLGDNAYPNGTDNEYQNFAFNVYPDLLRRTAVWPTLGNHDAVNANSATQTGVYYNIFSLPKSAEAGGLASGTEAYYSFDYGPVHFICLDSQGTSVAPGGAMLTWLENDLAATSQEWIVAFFHHPPYSKGSHDSDNPSDSGGRMAAIRQNALPVLEAGGVDLVLAGHSHNYERSYLLDGHYGLSGTLTPAMKLDAGSGREDQSGAYAKATLGPGGNEGAVYSVVGSSGQPPTGASMNHPAHYASLNMYGSLVMEIEGSRLDGTFLDNNGLVQDYFTITKGLTPTTGPAVLSYTARAMSPAQETVAPSGTAPTTTGSISATVNVETGQFDYKLQWNDLTGPVTGISFHGAAVPGTDAAATVSVTPATTDATGMTAGTATLSLAQAADLAAGLWYCDIRTAANPTGEIRGQLITDSASRKSVTFTGNPLADFGIEFRRYSSRAAVRYFMTWDDTNLYVAVDGDAAYAKTEPTMLYIDTDPVQGSRASTSGSAAPQIYDNRAPTLPFTGNVVVYFKSTYAELRSNTTGTWSGATVLTGNLNTSGANSIEVSIPWVHFPGGVRPARFHYCMMKHSGSVAGTSAYAFLPAVTAITDTVSNINTAGLRHYEIVDLATPFLSPEISATLAYNSGATFDFANTGVGGRLRHTRHLIGPAGSTFTGSATSPGGATIAAERAAEDRYWTVSYDGSSAANLGYGIQLDSDGVPGVVDPDRLLILKREHDGPWMPWDTTRVDSLLSAGGMTSFSDFNVGSDSTQLPAVLSLFSAE